MTCDHFGKMTARVTFTQFQHDLPSTETHGLTVEDVRCEECGERFHFGPSEVVTLHLRGGTPFAPEDLASELPAPEAVTADDFEMVTG